MPTEQLASLTLSALDEAGNPTAPPVEQVSLAKTDEQLLLLDVKVKGMGTLRLSVPLPPPVVAQARAREQQSPPEAPNPPPPALKK